MFREATGQAYPWANETDGRALRVLLRSMGGVDGFQAAARAFLARWARAAEGTHNRERVSLCDLQRNAPGLVAEARRAQRAAPAAQACGACGKHHGAATCADYAEGQRLVAQQLDAEAEAEARRAAAVREANRDRLAAQQAEQRAGLATGRAQVGAILAQLGRAHA